MSDYLIVLAFAALPALGNFAGGVLAEVFDVSRRVFNLALHAAAGIVIGVVAVEIMPRALESEQRWLIILAFVLGGVFYAAVQWGVGRLQERFGGEAGPWVIFFGVAVDLFSDGILIGTGSTVAVGLGLLLALGQVPADIPEGFASIADFKNAGTPRRTRLLLAAAFAVPIFLGATIGYWLMRDAPEAYQLALLTFTAGVLTTLVVEDLVPEAHEEGEGQLAPIVFVCGFALFALLSTYLG
jgi:zinc transporter, ZIP family